MPGPALCSTVLGHRQLSTDVRQRVVQGGVKGADHEVNTPLHHMLLVCLHVGDTIHHEATDAIRPLVHRHLMPHLVQLVSCRHTSWPTANHCNPLAGPELGWSGGHPPHLKALSSMLYQLSLELRGGEGEEGCGGAGQQAKALKP